MKNTITLPMSRVCALVEETSDAFPERVVAKLLSVLHGREMWAHFDVKKSTSEVAVFVYGANVPTPTRGAFATRDGKGVQG